MINYDYSTFINFIYYGEEVNFSYKDRKYFIQGWSKKIKDKSKQSYYHLEVARWVPLLQPNLWEYNSFVSMEECAKAFMDAKIFDGKSFPEIEHETESIDFPKDVEKETEEYWEKHPNEIPDGIK